MPPQSQGCCEEAMKATHLAEDGELTSAMESTTSASMSRKTTSVECSRPSAASCFINAICITTVHSALSASQCACD